MRLEMKDGRNEQNRSEKRPMVQLARGETRQLGLAHVGFDGVPLQFDPFNASSVVAGAEIGKVAICAQRSSTKSPPSDGRWLVPLADRLTSI